MVLIDEILRILESQSIPEDDPRWGQAWLQRGVYLASVGRSGEALRDFERTVEAARRHGWSVLAKALVHASHTAGARGDPSTAKTLGREALQLTEGQVSSARASALLNLMARRRGFDPRSEAAATEALRVSRLVGDDHYAVLALLRLADFTRVRGDVEGTRRLIDEGFAQMEDGNDILRAMLLNHSGELYRECGQLADAQAAYTEALQICECYDSFDVSTVRINLALVFLLDERHERARPHLDRARQDIRLSNSKPFTAAVALALCEVEANARNWSVFDAHLDVVVEALGATGFVDIDVAKSAERAGNLARRHGEDERAGRMWRLAMWQRTAMGSDTSALASLLNRLIAPA